MPALQLRAGVAEATITPPVGTPLLGVLLPSTGVHDELYARVLVLGDGSTTVALVSLDLVGLDLALAGQLRASLCRSLGFDAVALLCTHTHSAPFTIPWSLRGAGWSAEPEGQRWRADLLQKVTAAAARALSQLTPARLRAGRAAAQAGLNRRLATAEGVVMRPNPDGVVVPWVDVLSAEEAATGRPLALLFSHAAHPVIVHGASTLVSADYPGYAVAALREALGPEVLPLFAQGCGANINGEPLRGGFGAAREAGEKLAAAALQAAARATPVPPAPLRTALATAALPLQPLPPPGQCRETLAQAEARLAEATAAGAGELELWSLEDDVLCARDLLARAEAGTVATVAFETTAVAVGNWCLLALTHEVFADYQLWADGVSPFAHTQVAAYANGCETYLPTAAALAEGGYEGNSYPRVGAGFRYPYRVALQPGCEALVKETVQRALDGASAQGCSS